MSIVRPPVAWLAELTPFDPDAGSRVTVRVGSAPSGAFLGLNSQIWEPAMAERPRLAQEYFSPDFSGSVLIGRGEMAIATRALAEFSDAKRLIWRGAAARIWRGSSADWLAMKLSFEGLVASERLDSETGIVGLGLEVDTRDGDLLTQTFAGTGGREAASEHKGRLKPAGFGTWSANPPNIPVFFFDEINNVGIVDAYGNVTSFNALFENGASFGASVGNYASYEALVSAPLQPGQWATCLAEGMIRTGAPPKNGGVITCDAQFGFDRAGTMIRRIAQHHAFWDPAKIDVAAFNALDVAVNRRIRYWTENQRSSLELMQAIAAGANAQLVITLTGVLTVTRTVVAPISATVSRGGNIEPFVTRWSMLETDEPWWKIEAACAQVARKHDTSEIDYVAELVDRGDYDPLEIYRQGHIVRYSDGSRYLYINSVATAGNDPPTEVYWELFESGSGDVAALQAELDKIGADNWLVPVEKQQVIERYDDLWNEEYAPLIDRAQQFGVTTERTAYIAAFAALNAYLATIAPIAWNNTSEASAITRTAWRANWNTLFETRQSLLAAIEVRIKAVADAKTRNVPRGAYDSGTTYEAGDQVVFTGSTYQYINAAPSAGNDPPNATYWILVAAAGSGIPGADGEPGISAWLTNSNHTVATDSAGDGGSYSGAGGIYKIFKGATDLSGSATFSVAAKSPNTAWISIDAVGVFTVSDPGTDQATATLRAVVAGVNYDLTYTLSKNRSGQSVRLEATAQGFTFVDGVINPGGQSITFTAQRLNVPAGTAVFTTTPVVTLTGTGDSRTLSAANFGANRQVKIGVAIDGLYDEIIVLRLDQSTAQAGATVGAPPGTNVGNLTVEEAALGSDVEAIESFSAYADITAFKRAWNIPVEFGELAFSADSGSPGGKHLLVGGANGNDHVQFQCRRYFPYDPTKLHFVEFEFERISLTGAVYYFGLSCIDASGAEVPSDMGSFHYIAGSAITLSNGRHVLRAYFQGSGNPLVNTNNPDAPTPLRPNVVKYTPMMLIHYPTDGFSFAAVTAQTRLHCVRWGLANRGAPGPQGAPGSTGAAGAPGMSIAASVPIMPIASTSGGTPKAGQLPRSTQMIVYDGSTNVTAIASYSVTPSNCTVTAGGGGLFTLTGVSDDGAYFDVTATYSGKSITMRIPVPKVRDGKFAVGSSDSTLQINNTTSYSGGQGGPITLAVGPGTIFFDLDHTYYATSGVAALAGKFQYRTTPGSGGWIDVNAEVVGEAAVAADTAPGVLMMSATLAGPASALNWEFQYVNRRSGAGGSLNTASGSGNFEVRQGGA